MEPASIGCIHGWSKAIHDSLDPTLVASTHGPNPLWVKTIYTNLLKRSEKWQMVLHFWNCKCLHTGHGNLDVNYGMEDTVLLGTSSNSKC